MNIHDLHDGLIAKMHDLFQTYKGDRAVAFEVMELETVKKTVTPLLAVPEVEDAVADIELDSAMETELPVLTPEVVDEIRVVNLVTMPSRKLKVNISTEFLTELQKLQIDFKLN